MHTKLHLVARLMFFQHNLTLYFWIAVTAFISLWSEESAILHAFVLFLNCYFAIFIPHSGYECGLSDRKRPNVSLFFFSPSEQMFQAIG